MFHVYSVHLVLISHFPVREILHGFGKMRSPTIELLVRSVKAGTVAKSFKTDDKHGQIRELSDFQYEGEAMIRLKICYNKLAMKM